MAAEGSRWEFSFTALHPTPVLIKFARSTKKNICRTKLILPDTLAHYGETKSNRRGEKQRERERERKRETDRQTDRQTDSLTDRQNERTLFVLLTRVIE